MKSNLQDIWDNCLDILHKRTNRVLFESYFSNSKLVLIKENIAYIQVLDNFIKSRFESSTDDSSNSLYKEIVYVLSEVTGKEYSLVFFTEDDIFTDEKTEKEDKASNSLFDSHLNSRFTFDNFIIIYVR